MPDPLYRRFGVIGTGRVARALALGLAPHSAAAPLLWSRSASLPETPPSLSHLVESCDTIAIAVSDDAIDEIVATLAPLLSPANPRFIFHVSGRSGATLLAPLHKAGATIAAIHPVMTFTGDPAAEVARMAGARFAMTAPDAASMAQAHALVECLAGVAVEIAEHHRALYHAALCHAANHLVTLIDGAAGALTVAGVNDPAALLAPLVRAALANALDRGFAALSGPLLRGDGHTIASHIAALNRDDPALLPAYRAMALATLDKLPPAKDLREMLEAPTPPGQPTRPA